MLGIERANTKDVFGETFSIEETNRDITVVNEVGSMTTINVRIESVSKELARTLKLLDNSAASAKKETKEA